MGGIFTFEIGRSGEEWWKGGIGHVHFSTLSIPLDLGSSVRILAMKAGGSLNTGAGGMDSPRKDLDLQEEVLPSPLHPVSGSPSLMPF